MQLGFQCIFRCILHFAACAPEESSMCAHTKWDKVKRQIYDKRHHDARVHFENNLIKFI